MKSKPGSSLADLEIDLKEFSEALKRESGRYHREVKGDYGKLGDVKGRSPGAFRKLGDIYPPLRTLKAEALTYEIFIELINKTDFLLRKLVKSLEEKLASEGKNYQVEQARLRSKTFWKLNRKE